VLVETLTAVLLQLRVEAGSIIPSNRTAASRLPLGTHGGASKGRIVYDGASETLRADPDKLAQIIGIAEAAGGR
jgi:hypothetical protein